jgi:exosortase/archaeosortase family protein
MAAKPACVKRDPAKKIQPGLSAQGLRAEWRGWYEAKKPVLHFSFTFLALILLYYALLSTSFCERALNANLKADAWLTNRLLNLMDQHTRVTDVIITSQKFSMAIHRGCDAVEPTWLLCAAIIAFPGPLLRKLGGMLVGIVVLQALNLVRLFTLYWIGLHWGPALFNSAHVEIWPVIFIIVAIGIFVGWKTWVQSTPRPDAA